MNKFNIDLFSIILKIILIYFQIIKINKNIIYLIAKKININKYNMYLFSIIYKK